MRLAAIGLVFLAAGTLPAQIVLKPAGETSAPLRPKTLDLDVSIRKGVAESKFDYVFANEGQWRGEAEFLIAIPENGVVTGFAYWYEGEKVIARVTEKERAREIYRAITTRQRDPALIEMVGKRTFRVKVFPIEAGADLRVELKMVQALPSTANGPQLAVPLKRLGRLEQTTVTVRGEGPFATNVTARSEGDLQYKAENVSTPDLRVTAIRPKRPYVADLRAARSGGAGGFFALTLTAAKGMQRPKLSFSGVTVKDVMGVPSRMAPGKAYTVVGRYENVRPGARVYLAGASGARFSEVLDFSSKPEPNGPAAKLWAWAKIGRSTSRKEIVALSVRHTVPSRYTSWIAIPTEERKRFAREIALQDLRRANAQMARTIKRFGVSAPASQRAIAAYRKSAKALGLQPNEISSDDLMAYATTLAERWEREAKRRGDGSIQARRLQREMELLASLGAATYDIRQYHYGQAEELGRQVFEDRYTGRRTAAARNREARLAHHARMAGQGNDPQSYVTNAGGWQTEQNARDLAKAEREGRPATAAEKADLARRDRALGRPAGNSLREAHVQLATDEAANVASQIDTELRKEEPDLDQLRTLNAKRQKDREFLSSQRRPLPTAEYGFGQRAYTVVSQVVRGEKAPEEIESLRKKMRREAEAAGEPLSSVDSMIDRALDAHATEAWTELERQQYHARRNQKAFAEAQTLVQRLKALGAKEPKNTWGEYRGELDQELRNEYVRARHEGEDATELYARLRNSSGTWKGEHYPKTRADLLRTLTELDRLDSRPLSAGEQRTKAELERKANELHARIGDPIVTFNAPADAIGLTAVLPDGTRLPMIWVARHSRWEARFDIPAGTPDGPFAVRIDGAYADGRPIEAKADFRVDSAAPTITVERDGTVLVLKTDEDVARAVALGADGSRREMVRHSPGRFALRDAPAGDVRVIATDKAHNRSDMVAAEPLPVAERIDPAMNVQALARFGDRLWISTLDNGGRFDDGPVVPEVGAWPRQAVVSGETLAVRAATGEVHLFDGKTWSVAERDGTTLAADGGTLLVGIVGGWIERSPSGRKAFRPKDLSGRVVTCLFVDGNRVWVGTQGRGLYEWDRNSQTGIWHDERHGLTDDWITALGRDSSGRIVAGTFVGGALTLREGRWAVVLGTEGACVTAVLGDLVATRRGVVKSGKALVSGEVQALAPGAEGAIIGWRGRIGISPR